MTIQSTTKRLTTTASALSLGLLLSGPLAMAAQAPAATPPPAPAIETYPSWTPQERQQHWEQMQQSARELWAKVNLSPEQRQQYWEQVQQSARDLWAKWGLTAEQRQQYWESMQREGQTAMNPPAEAPPTAPAPAAVALAATPSAALPAAVTYPPERVYNILSLWGLTPEQRRQYWASMQQGG